jgi:3-methyladenine DNA glycosylase AlkD
MGTADTIQSQLVGLSNTDDALFLQRFFKTAPGEYGEGDLFRGIRVPLLRRISKACRDLPLDEAKRLLHSAYHEDRLLALLILVLQYAKAGAARRTSIYDLYLGNTRHINNWDLVDASAEHIVGAHLSEKSKKPLEQLAHSLVIWERRIAIMATFHFIKQGSPDVTLQVAEILLADREDLIHKATGWMLREVGKRDQGKLEEFLRKHYGQMPRTMLRYAIEKFPEDKRRSYLKGEFSVDSPHGAAG